MLKNSNEHIKPININIPINVNTANNLSDHSNNHVTHKIVPFLSSIPIRSSLTPQILKFEDLNHRNIGIKNRKLAKQGCIEPKKKLKYNLSNKQMINLHHTKTFCRSARDSHKRIVQQAESKSFDQTQNIMKDNPLPRDTIVELIMRDYELGKISLDNVKDTISGLINEEVRRKSGRRKNKIKKVTTPRNSQNALKTTQHQKNQKKKNSKLSNRRKIQKNVNEQDYKKMREDMMEQVIMKGINSSLMLQEEPDEEKHIKIKKKYEIATSSSIKNIQQQLYEERKSLPIRKKPIFLTFKDQMAVKIQNAWKQYKTRKIVNNFIVQRKNNSNSQTLQNSSYVQSKIINMKNHINFAQTSTDPFHKNRHKKKILVSQTSEKLSFNPKIMQALEVAKGTKLRQQELIKWDFIMQFIKKVTQNSTMSEQQCLCELMAYFEQIKTITQKQLIIDQLTAKDFNDFKNNKELDAFTDKMCSQELVNENEKYHYDNSNDNHDKEKFIEIRKNNHHLKDTNLQIIQQALENRNEKLSNHKEIQLQILAQKLISDQIQQEQYNQNVQKIEQQFKQKVMELDKAKKNLFKGYQQATLILQKQIFPNMARSSSYKELLSSGSMNFDGYGEEKECHQGNHEDGMKYSELAGQLGQIIYELSDCDLMENNDQQIQNQKHSDEVNQKLEKLSIENRQDIFQFIFLDLTLEIFLEEPKGCNIITKIQSFMQYQRKLSEVPKGIKTGLNACSEYLKKLYDYINMKYAQVLANLNNPLGPSASEMLKYIHDNINDSVESEDQNISNLILPIQIFQNLQGTNQSQLTLPRYYEDDKKEKIRCNFLKNIYHIHCKSLFDNLNENLDQQRPYGMWGKPFPWKKNINSNKSYSKIIQQVKLNNAVDGTLSNCSYQCGVLHDKEESVFKGQQINQEYLQQIRQYRMSKMLAADLTENQRKYVFYDDEEIQVLIDLCSLITKGLLNETASEIKIIIQ